MKIRRAVKCIQNGEELKEIIRVAYKTGIYGIEIQELVDLMGITTYKERGNIVLNSCKDYPFKYLVYHFPLGFSLDDISSSKRMDLASKEGEEMFHLTEDTIEEAGYVGAEMGINEVLVNVHLFGAVEPNEISIEERNRKMKMGEIGLEELKGMCDHYSKKYGVNLLMVRENNPPHHGKVDGLLDFDPRDTIRTIDKEIYSNLDFAHYWQYILLGKDGVDLPGARLSKEVYPDISMEKMVGILAPSLKIIHINDAGPTYMKDTEGVEIGKGTLPHKKLVTTISSNLIRNVIGTLEMKYGHLDPESIVRSDQRYREMFGDDFFEIFE